MWDAGCALSFFCSDWRWCPSPSPQNTTTHDTSQCAIRTNGSLSCWGSNTYGQLGDGTSTQRNAPTAVLYNSVTNWTAISTGQRHT